MPRGSTGLNSQSGTDADGNNDAVPGQSRAFLIFFVDANSLFLKIRNSWPKSLNQSIPFWILFSNGQKQNAFKNHKVEGVFNLP